MRAYHLSGSAELFPQHCQVPNLSRDELLKALTEELQTETTVVAGNTKRTALLKLLCTHLDKLISPQPTVEEQRVTDSQPLAPQPERMEFQRVTDSPAVMKARDPTANWNLVKTARTHQHQTQNNTPGDVPAIQRSPDCIPADIVDPTKPQRLPRITQDDQPLPNVTFTTMPTKGRPKHA